MINFNLYQIAKIYNILSLILFFGALAYLSKTNNLALILSFGCLYFSIWTSNYLIMYYINLKQNKKIVMREVK